MNLYMNTRLTTNVSIISVLSENELIFCLNLFRFGIVRFGIGLQFKIWSEKELQLLTLV